MREGIAREPEAAEAYANIKGVDILPCGIVISPDCFWLAASPDRRVIDTAAQPVFGLLEIKCPEVKDEKTLDDLPYLKRDGEHHLILKEKTNYFRQVMMQMAITGASWCDFFVYFDEATYMLQRINFDSARWSDMQRKIDDFYFAHYLTAIVNKEK